MTKYTVFNHTDSSVIYGRGLTAEAAMSEILTYDGREFEIHTVRAKPFTRRELYSRDRNSQWLSTGVLSLADTRAKALREIALKVISARWDRHPEAMPDQDFDAMVAQALEDAE
jgi:hypothetical protein